MQDSAPNIISKPNAMADIDLRSLVLMLWRRRFVFLVFILAGISCGFFALATLKPQYTARTIILLEVDQTPNPVDKISMVLSGGKFDASVVLNELEILRSNMMARKLIQKLALMADPEFNPRFKELQNEHDEHTQKFRNLSLYGRELETLPPEVFDTDLADVAQRVMDKLRIRSISGSYALQIEFTSDDAAKAALISNKIADLYIEQRLEHKFKSARKMTEFLDSRLNDLRRQLREAEIKVEKYRAQQNLLEGPRASVLSAEQISQLSRQLTAARIERAREEAKLDQIRRLDGDYSSIEALAEVSNAKLLHQLKREEAALDAEISQLSSRYGEKHPEMINRRLKIAEIRSGLRNEIKKLEAATKTAINFADSRVQALEQELFAVEGHLHDDNAAMIRLREYEREAEVARLVFDRFFENYKRAGEQEKLRDAEARIISYATVPRTASFPNKKLIMILSLLISAFLGLIAVIICEKLDNTYRNGADFERDFGYPCYGLIPAAKIRQRPATGRYVLDNPTSSVAEAVRTLRMVLNLRAGKKPKVITLTSSFSGEGKTTLSLWLARLAAKAGDKAIIIDADLRHPNLHAAVGLENEVSLVDYLSGDKTLDEVVCKDQDSDAYMIFGQSVPEAALDLISSQKLSDLVDMLRERYDLVIIDTPSCLAVSDARLLATLSDHMLYAVAWNKTRCESVASGIKQFADIGLKSIAFVLTNVNIRKHMRYGYGDIAVYHNAE